MIDKYFPPYLVLAVSLTPHNVWKFVWPVFFACSMAWYWSFNGSCIHTHEYTLWREKKEMVHKIGGPPLWISLYTPYSPPNPIKLTWQTIHRMASFFKSVNSLLSWASWAKSTTHWFGFTLPFITVEACLVLNKEKREIEREGGSRLLL